MATRKNSMGAIADEDKTAAREIANSPNVTNVEPKEIVLPPLDVHRVVLFVRGITPYLSNAFSEKALQMMRNKGLQIPTQKKGPRDPDASFRGSLHPVAPTPGEIACHRGGAPDPLDVHGRFGIPVLAFKCAMVAACRCVDGMKMTQTYGSFHVDSPVGGSIIPIDGSEPIMREDHVRLAGPGGVADLRYRGEFAAPWFAKIPVRFNPRMISIGQLANLLNNAGFSVGTGEWRVERKGDHGQFEVIDETDYRAGIAGWRATKAA